MNEQLYGILKKFGRVKHNAPLAPHTTFKIGGSVQFLVEVVETGKLAELLNWLRAEGIDWFILGGGSNVLWQDQLYEGVVIKIKTTALKVQDSIIEAAAGAELSALVNLSLAKSLSGLEWAAGIPGGVGGAVRGNAGARYEVTGGEIKDSLIKVEVWRDGEVLELTPAECEFAYRDSVFKRNHDVILRVWFKLYPGDAKKSVAMAQEILRLRRSKQPVGSGAGSFFKNVPLRNWPNDPILLPPLYVKRGKIPAAWLIEQVGLKGFTVGGAGISEEHGNFLINFKNASQADVLAVVEEVKKRVYDKFGVKLEEEVSVV